MILVRVKYKFTFFINNIFAVFNFYLKNVNILNVNLSVKIQKIKIISFIKNNFIPIYFMLNVYALTKIYKPDI